MYQLGRGAYDLQLVPAIEPLFHFSYTQNAGKIGFANTFAKKFIEGGHSKFDKVLIVPCGRGASGFSNNLWNPGNENYNDFVTRINAAKKYGPVRAILWNQGGTDREALSNAEFINRNKVFWAEVQKDTGVRCPIITGCEPPFSAEKRLTRLLNETLKHGYSLQRGELFGHSNAWSPKTIYKTDNNTDMLHYDAAGQRIQGLRYYDEYDRLKSQQTRLRVPVPLWAPTFETYGRVYDRRSGFRSAVTAGVNTAYPHFGRIMAFPNGNTAQITTPVVHDPSKGFTVSMWVKHLNLTGNQAYFGSGPR